MNEKITCIWEYKLPSKTSGHALRVSQVLLLCNCYEFCSPEEVTFSAIIHSFWTVRSQRTCQYFFVLSSFALAELSDGSFSDFLPRLNMSFFVILCIHFNVHVVGLKSPKCSVLHVEPFPVNLMN